MKELPGAPVLPEGWFYRVTTDSFGSTGRQFFVEVRRPVFGWTVKCGRRAVVYDGGWKFFSQGEKPTLAQLARAARMARTGNYGDTDILGDYR